jgi:hypothetical protein
MAGCTACSREARALEALAQTVRAGAHTEDDELHVRRERTRLLAAFDRTLVPEERPTRRWIWVGPIVGVAVLTLVFAVRRPRPSEAPPSDEQSTVIQADSAARYSRWTEDHHERIVLERGALRIQVNHPHPPDGTTLLVVLPDGELEDTGTTFTVIAADGRTTKVAVETGAVVLRLRERPALVLHQGEVWTATAEAPASVVPSVAAPIWSPPPPPPASATAQAAGPDPSTDFRDATAALQAREDRRAAVMFARFLETYPRDSRAEDAAYLRVVALNRAGSDVEMREAAQFYLHRYPAGFRHAEVERLSEPIEAGGRTSFPGRER